MRLRSAALLWLTLACVAAFAGYAQGEGTGRAKPGPAGYALVFHDTIVAKKHFKGFPTTAMTFEAWLSTTDFCHSGAIMSYAVPTDSNDLKDITEAANHFVIFDVKNVIACHDFEFIDVIPDYLQVSCHGHYNKTPTDINPITGAVVDREGKWHHLAVTWDSTKEGETIVYIDGRVVGHAKTGRTNQIEEGGYFMLGGEQDCFGGCTDPKQGYYGLMDEVRIWDVVRTQDEIVNTMRSIGDLPDKEHLVAYWKFDDPGSENYRLYGILSDSSGHGNDLDLLVPPLRSDVILQELEEEKNRLSTGALTFKNNYAFNPNMNKMPTKDITIEFWARSGALGGSALSTERHAEFVSYAAFQEGDGDVENDLGLADAALLDDAIRIERYLTEYNETQYLKNTKTSTLGSVSVHINSNRQGNGKMNDNWLDFDTDWTDDKWHHIAVTWRHSTGETKVIFDGVDIKPFWRAQNGRISDADPSDGGVTNKLAAKSTRSSFGSLVLGQNQECYGGCFSSSSAFNGQMANFRVWDRVLEEDEIKRNMFANTPANTDGLVMNFIFESNHFQGKHERNRRVIDTVSHRHLELGSVAPAFQFSTVPLTDSNGKTVGGATEGAMGYALELSDQQLLMIRNFLNFPSTAITVEFWMLSTDACRQGVPFSYAHGEYQSNDNAFLIFNYNDWGIAVMEDEGTVEDHNAGFASTDGRWHHIAVTWESKTGTAVLYDNGMPQWRVKRAKGKSIPQGGTLVIGREQDCLGGCFDSAPGAMGDVQKVDNMEYGPQDFYGIIEQVRIWKRVRTQDEILEGMYYDKDVGSGLANNEISSKDPDMVAWWKFDEGSGYTVSDATGHGNTLRIMSEPKWVVPSWVETCGDGNLDSTEDCDDGNRQNGDGCDEYCIVEEGFMCTVTSPSNCYGSAPDKDAKGDKEGSTKEELRARSKEEVYEDDAKGEETTTRSHRHRVAVNSSPFTDEDESAPAEPAATKKKKSSHRSSAGTVFLVLFIFALIGFVAFLVYKKRETVYEYAPGLRTVVNNAQDRVNAALGRTHHGYDLAAVDPEEAYVSPGFVDSQPPGGARPSGGNVPYEPIGDETSRPAR